jgi:hypothetical protein
MNTINAYKLEINTDDDDTNNDNEWINWNIAKMFNVGNIVSKMMSFNITINNFGTFLKDRGLDIILVADQANNFVCTSNDTFTRVIDVYNNLFDQNYYEFYTSTLNDIVVALNGFTFDNTQVDDREDIYNFFSTIQTMFDPIIEQANKNISIINKSMEITTLFQQTLTINSTVGIALSVSQQAWELAILLNKHNYKTNTLESTSDVYESEGVENQELDVNTLFPTQIDSTKINNIKLYLELLKLENGDIFYTNVEKTKYIKITKAITPKDNFNYDYETMNIYDANTTYNDNRNMDGLISIFKNYQYLKDMHIDKELYLKYCTDNNVDAVSTEVFDQYYDYYHFDYSLKYNQYLKDIMYIQKINNVKNIYENIDIDINQYLETKSLEFYGENNLSMSNLILKNNKNSLDDYLINVSETFNDIIETKIINFKDEYLKFKQFEHNVLLTVTEYNIVNDNIIEKVLENVKISATYFANKYYIISGNFKIGKNIFNKFNDKIYHNYENTIISEESDGYYKTENNVIETIYNYSDKKITKIKGVFDIYTEEKFRGFKIYDNIKIESSINNGLYKIRKELIHKKTETIFDNDNVVVRVTTGITNVYRQQMIDGKIDFVEARQKSILKSLAYLQVKYKMDKYIDDTWVAEIPRIK